MEDTSVITKLLLMLTLMVSLVLSLSSEGAGIRGSGKLSWTIPTKRVDGSALALQEIKQYQIEATCNSREAVIYTIPNPSTITWNIPESLYGKCYFRINTVDVDNLTGPWSDSVNKLLKLNKPQSGGFR